MSDFKDKHVMLVTGAVTLTCKGRDVVDRISRRRSRRAARTGLILEAGFSGIVHSNMGPDSRTWLFDSGPEGCQIVTAIEDLVLYREYGGCDNTFVADPVIGTLHFQVYKRGSDYQGTSLFAGNIYVHRSHVLVTVGGDRREPSKMAWFKHTLSGPVAGPSTDDVWNLIESVAKELEPAPPVPAAKKPKGKVTDGLPKGKKR